MKNPSNTNDTLLLSKIYKDLEKIYALIEIEQEALDLCRENEKDPTHIIIITDIILDKLKFTLSNLKPLTKT